MPLKLHSNSHYRLASTAKRLSSALALALTLGFAAQPAFADISVQFTEGAPKDRFEITNQATCAINVADLTIDLGASAAGLIFDVTAAGAGVQVFQPFELVAGANVLASTPKVLDGDKKVVLPIRKLDPKARIIFTIDVDDANRPQGIIIAGSEIEGAMVALKTAGVTTTGRFTRQGKALVKTPPCL